MEKDGYSWWIRRIRRAQNLFDEFRIDHFRGFAGYWAVPTGMYTLNNKLISLAWCVVLKCVWSTNVQKQK